MTPHEAQITLQIHLDNDTPMYPARLAKIRQVIDDLCEEIDELRNEQLERPFND